MPDRRKVYKDTVEKCTNGKFKDLPFTKSILYENDLPEPYITGDNKPIIKVVNQDVLLTAIEMKENVLILNLASWKYRGGGAETGAMAQEEELFRRSNYFKSFDDKNYHMKVGESFYTDVVTIIKDNMYKDLLNPFIVSMIAMSALQNPTLTAEGNLTEEDYSKTEMIIGNIFKVAIQNGKRNIILGAIGCGVYGNPSHDIINIFNEKIRIYGSMFDNIVFSVLSSGNNENFDIFNRFIICEK